MASYVTNLDVFVPFGPYMSEYSVLILDTAHQLYISIQYPFVTLAQFQVKNSEIILENVLHVDCCLWGVTRTEGVEGIHHTHVKVDCFGLEQG